MEDVRRGGRLARFVVLGLFAWCLLAWFALRPPEISSDWNSWRQADTQTIALNFLKPGSSVLMPVISWGGDGPGYVEAELQLYTKVTSVVMAAFGPGEWAGQLISLLAAFGTGLVLFFHLTRNHRPWAAALGVVAFLGARTTPHLATVVMPDSSALLAYAAAWAAFCRYLADRRISNLIAYTVCGALAMLIKPTMAHLGISSFVLLALADRAKLKDYRVWMAWLTMVAATALYFAHAHRLHMDYGNTFGLLAGEDSKTPKLRHLLMPSVLFGALRNLSVWGLGHLGAVALLLLAVRRRLQPEHYALLLGNVIIALLALRYMSQDAGDYYFAPASVLGALAVAALAEELAGLQKKWRPALLLAALCLALGLDGVRSLQIRYFYAHFNDPEVAGVVATGKELAQLTVPGELLVVRSPNEAYDTFWQSGRNYHEPRIFYLSGTHGWTLGREQDDVNLLAAAVGRGARYFADPLVQRSAKLDAWLASTADLIWTREGGGRIWRFHGARADAL